MHHHKAFIQEDLVSDEKLCKIPNPVNCYALHDCNGSVSHHVCVYVDIFNGLRIDE